MASLTRKQIDEKRRGQLNSERSSFIDYWRELSDIHLAHRGRFLASDMNKGVKRNTKQLNNTSRLGVRTLASGMMAGITSPARPWFRLSTPYPELNELNSVAEWLHDCEALMREVFSQSNLYNCLHTIYAELGTFGTGALGIFEDFENVIWFRPYTIGSYAYGMNGRNVVDTMVREYEITVQQCVDEFGIDNVSTTVKGMWDNGNLNGKVKVCHLVEPNTNYNKQNPLAKFKKFKSVYYEMDAKTNDDKYLRESGFDSFPILAPRWDTTGEDIYGTDCPGMMCLGDAKELQLLERRMAQAIDKVANPPVQAPSSLRSTMNRGGIAAGEVVWVSNTADGGIRSIYDYRPDLAAIQAKIDTLETRINESFYVDLFLMLANTDRRQITAREIAERHEEKLLMLGPVLERLHSELLDPLIDRTFNIMQKAGIFPEPPEELEDMDLRVEYVSVLAQAQRMVAVSGIERLFGYVAQVVQIDPSARHKFDAAQSIDEYAEAMGTSPRILRGDDEYEAMVTAEQQAQAAQQAAATAQQGVDMAQQASQVDTTEGNALSDVMRAAGLQ